MILMARYGQIVNVGGRHFWTQTGRPDCRSLTMRKLRLRRLLPRGIGSGGSFRTDQAQMRGWWVEDAVSRYCFSTNHFIVEGLPAESNSDLTYRFLQLIR